MSKKVGFAPLRFAANQDRSIGDRLSRLDELPTGDLPPKFLSELLGLQVDAKDRIFFATGTVRGEPATWGVVLCLDHEALRVRALFDPAKFKTWAEKANGA